MNKCFIVFLLCFLGCSVSAKDDSFPAKQYRTYLEVGGGLSLWSWRYGSEMYSLDNVHGYQLSPSVFAGIGAGFRYNTSNPYHDFPPLITPVFANMRFQVGVRRVSPVLSGSMGYSFSWRDRLKPAGLLVAGNLGMNIRLNPKHSLHWGLGYELQRFRITEYDSAIDWTGTADLDKHFIKFNIGFQF